MTITRVVFEAQTSDGEVPRHPPPPPYKYHPDYHELMTRDHKIQLRMQIELYVHVSYIDDCGKCREK